MATITLHQRKPQARREPRGRRARAGALDAVRAHIGAGPYPRDQLLEYLHRLNDAHAALFTDHLAALAELTDLPLAEIYETATFYAHFRVLDQPVGPQPLTLRVCDGLSCALAGAEALIDRLEARAGPGLRVERVPCVGRCDTAPIACIGQRYLDHAEADAALRAAQAGPPVPLPLPQAQRLVDYLAEGGYRSLRALDAGTLDPTALIEAVGTAKLRGLGGAGFPAGRKWSILREQHAPRLMAVNADEGEPGTFKDRHIFEHRPHQFLEGMLIAAAIVGAEAIYLYLRDEYPSVHALLEQEIAALDEAGLTRGRVIHLRRGAGAYICGEESAMIESLEGKRGYPRHRPPYVAQVGLFGRPTLVHNVETLYWVPEIVRHGPAWFNGQGRNGRQGLRLFSLSGRVNRPGVKLAPAGITVRELIEEFAGGMAEGHRFKAYLPGGASGGILPASLGDVPLDFDTLQEHGCFIGSGAVVVLSEHDDMRDVARNLMRFFAHESCGQCTPCRSGTAKTLALMQREVWDVALLQELFACMRDASICGLGQAAPNPVEGVIRHFPLEVGA